MHVDIRQKRKRQSQKSRGKQHNTYATRQATRLIYHKYRQTNWEIYTYQTDTKKQEQQKMKTCGEKQDTPKKLEKTGYVQNRTEIGTEILRIKYCDT